ncbi:MAG: PaaX family transcriptional regulator C-terminal domain-containing protein [Betaproteobacteria bacterium]
MNQEKSVSRPPATLGYADPPVTLGYADPAVSRWVQRTLKADPPRAKSLIVTVWGDALAPHGATVWLAGLFRLMAPFGINERLVRTSVFRLARDAWLDATPFGRVSRYQLTPGGRRRFDDAHRRIYTRPDDEWKGDWELVSADALTAAQRSALREQMTWSGFGALGPTVFIRPLQPERPMPEALAAPGLATKLVFAMARDAPARRSLASSVDAAWDLHHVAADYRRFLQRFGGVIDRFRAAGERGHDPQQCFVVRTLLIHAYRRVLLRDPLLPGALLPLDWPGAAAYALCRDFYRLTHRCAERHLAATLADADEEFPPADESFYRRFGGLD